MCEERRSIEEVARFEVVVKGGTGQVEADISAEVVRPGMTVHEAEQAAVQAVECFLTMLTVQETEIIPEGLSISIGLRTPDCAA